MNASSASFALVFVFAAASAATAQDTRPRPEETEVWKPVPAVVTAGRTDLDPPSDAIVLFGGKNESEWVSVSDHSPAKCPRRGGGAADRSAVRRRGGRGSWSSRL